MPADGLAGFRVAVLADRALQDQLLATTGRDAFVAVVVAQARARGWDVERADVEEGLRESRAAWALRWI